MRTFSLNFKMAPSSSTEADNIKKLIECFKFATLPRFGGASDENASFVNVPQLVDVEFMTGNKSIVRKFVQTNWLQRMNVTFRRFWTLLRKKSRIAALI